MNRIIRKKKCKGQAIVEYIIIIVIVAVAALAVLGIFSDTIKDKIGAVAVTFGADSSKVKEETDKKSEDSFKGLTMESVESNNTSN